MRISFLCAIVILIGSFSHSAQDGKKSWMDVEDCPAKHPGPWLKSKDDPEQAKLRKELAAAGKIAFASNRDGNWEIYVTNPDGSGQKNLSKNPAWDVYPRWTPDGKQIIFFSDRDSPVKLSSIYDQLMDGPPTGLWTYYRRAVNRPPDVFEAKAMPECGIYIMNADGSGVKQLVKEARRADMSPDGTFLTFERKGKTITRNLQTGEEFDAVQRYFGGTWFPEFSADRKRLLVASVGDTIGEPNPRPALLATIFDLGPDAKPTGKYHNVITGGLSLCPRWRPDGKGFVVVQGTRDLRLQEVDLKETPNEKGFLDGKTIGLATPADRCLHAHPAYSPAGKYIAFSLSPVHYLVRDRIQKLGYRPWSHGNQIIWQELCVGRSVAGKDNVWIPITKGGYANRDADWFVPQ